MRSFVVPCVVLASTVLSFVSRTASAEEPKHGEPAPAVSGDDWVQHQKLDPKVLKGRVVALAFVRIADTKCLDFLEEWDKLRQEFVFQPVTFLAVTSEKPDFVRKHVDIDKVPSPVLVDSADAMGKAWEVKSFPAVAVIDSKGNVAYLGKPPQLPLVRDALFSATDIAQWFAPLPKKWSTIEKTAQKFEFGHAMDAIDKALPGATDEADKTALESTKALFQQIADSLVEAVKIADKKSDWLTEVVALRRLIDDFAGNAVAATAKDDLAKLQARTDVKDEVSAAIEYSKAERYERERNWKSAARAYEALAKAKPNTAAGKKAADLAGSLAKRKT